MSKLCFGILLAIGLAIGCGAVTANKSGVTVYSRAAYVDGKKVNPVSYRTELTNERLIRVSSLESLLHRHSTICVIRDAKTGQEYIYASNYNGGVALIKVEDHE